MHTKFRIVDDLTKHSNPILENNFNLYTSCHQEMYIFVLLIGDFLHILLVSSGPQTSACMEITLRSC